MNRATFHSALVGLVVGGILAPAVQGGFVVHAGIALLFAAAFGGAARWVTA